MQCELHFSILSPGIKDFQTDELSEEDKHKPKESVSLHASLHSDGDPLNGTEATAVQL